MKENEPIPTERKSYTPPELVEYGDLETLTQGSGSQAPGKYSTTP
jgi:hypothetical protein